MSRVYCRRLRMSAARYVSVVVALTALLGGPVRAECWHLDHQWPSDGYPVSIAVDASGQVYVVCHDADHAVQKYSTNGKLLAEWGRRGSDPGQLLAPRGIAVDRAGDIYVADTGNHRVQKFRRDGTFVRAWRTYGKGDIRTFRPHGIATDPSGPYVYITDDANSRVLKFTDRGFPVRAWGGYGRNQDQFLAPRHITTDNAGLVYVVDSAAGCVKKFNHLGEFKGLWGSSENQTPYFVNPVGVAVDCAGYLWVTDGSHRVQQFWQAVRRRGWFGGSNDPEQGDIGSWHRFDSAHRPVAGAGPGQFRDPCGLAVDLAGNVYVADFANRRIQKLASLETGAPGMLSQSAWSSATVSR